jgi:DNA-directed RNA polymerase
MANEKPKDLYAAVAKETRKQLDEAGGVFGKGWLKHVKIDRKIVKRAVMVVPYGGSYSSCSDYVRDAIDDYEDKHPRSLDWIKEPAKKRKQRRTKREKIPSPFKVLSSAVWGAIKVEAKRPKEAMKRVTRWAETWEKKNQQKFNPLRWTAPSGFPVVCDYFVWKATTEDAADLNARPRSIKATERTDKLDWKHTTRAAPPNFIHSLDASHLVFSVNRARAEGISQLATVHDAFGTTPARAGKLAAVLRDEFAKLYSSDQFAPLADAARQFGGFTFEGSCKEAAVARLDPSEVRDALYLFS